MILPIYTYGQPVLKKMAVEITKDYEGLAELVPNMFETMYSASGVGLAAPQIGLNVRIFVVDTIQIMDDDKKGAGIKKAFINAQIIEESGDLWAYEEGCLSIPNVRGEVERQPRIKIQYVDEQFKKHEDVYEGINARVIQHEYDHIEGILFTEKLKPLKKRLVQRKLNDIKAGKMQVDYRVKVAKR